jgi:hypothetical protein
MAARPTLVAETVTAENGMPISLSMPAMQTLAPVAGCFVLGW